MLLTPGRSPKRKGKTMFKAAHILLVEDNRMDIELTIDAFREQRLGNSIHIAANGQEAMDYLLGADPFADREAYPLPDLILLDLKMPVMDGYEVLRRIKSTPGLKRLPVIVLSSSKEEGDRAMTYDSGVNSYLVKPVSFDGFLDVVKRIESYWLTLNVPPPVRPS
jgi:CheY-like chemotaxis protein